MKIAVRAASAAVLAYALVVGRAADAATAPCARSPFPIGSELPEPGSGPAQRIARIFALRSADGTLRAGWVYLSVTGATYYLSETDGVTPKAVAIEMGFLEAAGYATPLARRYTHLAEIPAVPPVAHALDLAKRRGLDVIACR